LKFEQNKHSELQIELLIIDCDLSKMHYFSNFYFMEKRKAEKNNKGIKTEKIKALKFELLNFKSRILWISTTLVFVFSFLIYSNTINHDYALDDTGAIQQNLNVKKGLKGIPDILKMDLWEQSEVRLGYYRPLSLITFAVEYQFFQSAPHLSHFNNVLLFAISCGSFICVAGFIRKCSSIYSPGDYITFRRASYSHGSCRKHQKS